MTDPSLHWTTCPRCGAVLPGDSAGPLCPACLLQSPAGARAQAAWTVGPGRGFEPPTPAALAEYFPQLEIEELLGRGGMGAVYRARQKSLDRYVALKILPPEVASRPGFSARFTREAQALARLSHPNIVIVFDFGQTGPYAYLVMEYVDGVNLRQVQADGRLSPEEALGIVPQLCDALHFAHAHGVVHRDIKPENILLDSRGNVKIADFGLAKLIKQADAGNDATASAQVVGTMYYMAPEQIEHPEQVDHRADIYSMGVVIYEMLTGELPLGRFEPPSQRVHIDVRLDEVVLRTLEKRPERRYSSAADVKTDVQHIESTPHESAPHDAAPRDPAAARDPQASFGGASGPSGGAAEAWPDRLERYARAAGRGASHAVGRAGQATRAAWQTAAVTGSPFVYPAETLAAAAIFVQLFTAAVIASANRDEAIVFALLTGGSLSLILARLALFLAGPRPLTPILSWLIGVPLAVIYLPILLVVVFWPLAVGIALAVYFNLSVSGYTHFSADDLRHMIAVILLATGATVASWWMLLSIVLWRFPGLVRTLLSPFTDRLDAGHAKWFALLFLLLGTPAVVGLVIALQGPG